MRVRDVMTTDVVTVGERCPFREIVATLADHGISGVPVVDGDGLVCGVVTEADLLGREAYGHGSGAAAPRLPRDVLFGSQTEYAIKAESRTAAGIMTRIFYKAGPDEQVASVARRMLRTGVKQMPVLDGGRLVGVVSRRDLLGVFDRDDDEIVVDVKAVLAKHLFLPPEHEVAVEVHDGVVTVAGTVRNRRDVEIVGRILGGIDGVVDVDNRLTFTWRTDSTL